MRVRYRLSPPATLCASWVHMVAQRPRCGSPHHSRFLVQNFAVTAWALLMADCPAPGSTGAVGRTGFVGPHVTMHPAWKTQEGVRVFPAAKRANRRDARLRMGGAQEGQSNLNELKVQLEAAIVAEDYSAAARLRDEIQSKSSDASLGVLGANAEFYRSFREGDATAMSQIWVEEDDGVTVACVHPAMPLITGRHKVLESWRQILSSSPPNIQPENAQLVVSGDTAWVMNEEVIDHGGGQPVSKCMATNIFVQRKGAWKIVHHQGGPLITPREFVFQTSGGDPIL